ncbi:MULTISPECIES: MFS transporter [Amycolatopsis]|uniref:Multidrug resistance protein n=1 Tax=Amycolatopsis bullii TaxID=941987 RepID=A0ABQ3KPQ3_9PSEU|nr:MFS transporter [Amycolatopsis bullii]GHG41727.1 multidrug resistance protein [Amycolatopsis bullii]
MNTGNVAPRERAAAAPAVRVATPWLRFALLYAVLCLMGVETFLISPLLPTIASDLGASTQTTATVVTAYVLTYAIVGPFVGARSDRAPRRVFVTAGLGLFLIGNLLCGLAPGIGLLIAARALTGLGGAIAAPAMWAYFAETARPTHRGKAIGLGAASYALGQVLGVPVGATVAHAANWRWNFFAVAAGLVLIVPIIAWRLSGPRPEGHASLGGSFRIWRSRPIRSALLATALLQGGRLGTYTYAGALLTQRFGLSVGQLGLVGMVVGAASLIGSMLAGPLLDRAHRFGNANGWLAAAWAVLFSVAVTVASLSNHFVLSVTALAVWFVAGGAFYTTQQTYLSSAEPRQRASTVSWNNAMENAGVAAATSLLGLFPLGGLAFTAAAAGLGLGAAAISATRALTRSHAFEQASR